MKRIVSLILVTSVLWLLVLPACNKEVSLETGSNPIIDAVGSLKDTLGNCLPDSVAGTFYNGITPGSDTAYVQIQVNVTTAGSYTISTDQQNGFMFADSGFFASTGLNIVNLKPIGTPILPIPTTFTVVFDTSICTFTVDVQDSTGTGLGTDSTNIIDTANLGMNTWRFTGDSKFYKGFVTSSVFDTSVLPRLSIDGPVVSGADSTILIFIVFPTNTITPGTYPTNTDNNFLFYSDGDVIYNADSTTLPDITNITIHSYDSSTKEMTGTFNGTAKDALGASVPIYKGAFRAKVN